MSAIPSIVINGRELTPELANMVRVACAAFDADKHIDPFSEDPNWKSLAAAYTGQIKEVLEAMTHEPRPKRPSGGEYPVIFRSVIRGMPGIPESVAKAESKPRTADGAARQRVRVSEVSEQALRRALRDARAELDANRRGAEAAKKRIAAIEADFDTLGIAYPNDR